MLNLNKMLNVKYKCQVEPKYLANMQVHTARHWKYLIKSYRVLGWLYCGGCCSCC